MHTPSTVRSIAVLSALACLACAPAAHAQVTLDFENLSNPSNGTLAGQGISVTQNGFTVANAFGNPFYSIEPNVGSPFNYTGSVALLPNDARGTTTLTQNNGTSFTLNSVDIANSRLQSNFVGGVSVNFTGNKQGGGTVTQTFTHAASNSFQTVTFGSNFTNLLSVTFTGLNTNSNPYSLQFDNIILNAPAAVPEPGNVALLFGAVVTGVGFVRRGRGKRCVR